MRNLFCLASIFLYLHQLLVAQECFIDELQSKNVYTSDIIAYDLSTVSRGDNVSFSLVDPPTDSSVILWNTFRPIESKKTLDPTVQGCTTYAPINNTDYVYICNNNLVLFLGYNEMDGTVVRSSNLSLNASWVCNNVVSNTKKGAIYAVCNDTSLERIIVQKIDYVTLTPANVLYITQAAGQTVSGNLAVARELYTVDNLSYSTILYIYPSAESTSSIFRIVKDNINGELIDGGYYNAATNITGIDASSNFLGVMPNNNNTLYLILRFKPTQELYLQSCYPVPVSNTFNCNSDILYLKTSMPDIVYALHQVSIRTTYAPDIYLLSLSNKTTTVVYQIDIFNITAGILNTYTIDTSSSGMDSVYRAFIYEFKVYIIGRSSGNSNTVILLYRLLNSMYESQTYRFPFSISHIRRGTYDTDVDEHIAIYGNEVYFSLIDKPELVLLPSKVMPKQSLNSTVACSVGGKQINTRFVKLDILTYINDQGDFNAIQTLNAYTEGVRITIPVLTEGTTGNAPKYEGRSLNPNFPATFRIDHCLPMVYTEYKGGSMLHIIDLQYMGQGIYMIQNATHLAFTLCMSNQKYGGVCDQLPIIPFTNKQILNGIVFANSIITLESSNMVSGLAQGVKPNVTVMVRDIFNPNFFIEFPTVGLRGTAGQMKSWGTKVYILLAGRYDGELDSYFMVGVFDMNKMNMTVNFTKLLKIEEHMCINDIKFAPRGVDVVYMSSSCNNNPLSSRVYEVYLTLGEQMRKFTATIVRSFSEINTTSFDICPTGELLTIIDLQNNAIFSLDIDGDESTRFVYGVSEYDITNIQHYYCDQENKIFQIIGTNADRSNFMLVTYNGDSVNKPTNRVHSIYNLADSPRFIASTYNYDTDEINTLLLGDNTDTFSQFRLFLGAPLVYVNASKTVIPGNYRMELKATYPGSGGSSKYAIHYVDIDFMTQVNNVIVTSKNKSKPLPVTGSVSLDDDLVISGPVVKFEMARNEVVTLFDRLYASDMYKNFQDVFDQSVLDCNMILGSSGDTIKLYKDGTELISMPNKRVMRMYALGNCSGFMALVYPTSGINNEVAAFLQKDGGWKTYVYPMGSQYVEDMMFYMTSKGYYMYAAYEEDNYSIRVGLLDIQNGNLYLKQELRILNKNAIIDFDAVMLPQSSGVDYMLVISSEEQSKDGKFNLFKVSGATLSLVGRQSGPLIPDVQMIHDQIDFSCNAVANTSGVADCFHTEPNYNSYYVRYTVDFAAAANGTSFVNATVLKFVKNVVNMKPLFSTLLAPWAAVVVQNLNVDPKADPNSIYSQSHLLFVYNFQYQVDPFKILNYQELGLNQSIDLENLEPCFFVPLNSTGVKLGVNVGTANSSIRVFNLDSLKLVVNNANKLPSSFNLVAVSANNSQYSTDMSQLYQLPSNTPTTPKKKLGLFIAIGAGIILIVGGLVLFYFYKKTRGVPEEDMYTSEKGVGISKLGGDDQTIKGGDQSQVAAAKL